jgi:uncharacterized membrane protein (UPF0127 family)
MKLPSSTWLALDDRNARLRIFRAESFWSRARGLIGRAPLAADEALWIRPCNSVHTFGMSYPIDVLFLDRQQRVIRVVHLLQRRRMVGARRAHSTLELLGGMASSLNLIEGMRLKVIGE